MHCIAVRRFRGTFDRSSLYSIKSTNHLQKGTGLHCVLFALCLTWSRCVWFCTGCIWRQIIPVVKSLLRQRCGSSISPSLFDDADPSLILMTKRHSKGVVLLSNSFEKTSSLFHQRRNPECSVEKDGCGLMVWHGQRHQRPTQPFWSSQKQMSCIFLHDVWRVMIDFGIKITVRDQSLLNVRSRENTHTLTLIDWMRRRPQFFQAKKVRTLLKRLRSISCRRSAICSITANWMCSRKISVMICGAVMSERVISLLIDHAKILFMFWNQTTRCQRSSSLFVLNGSVKTLPMQTSDRLSNSFGISRKSILMTRYSCCIVIVHSPIPFVCRQNLFWKKKQTFCLFTDDNRGWWIKMAFLKTSLLDGCRIMDIDGTREDCHGCSIGRIDIWRLCQSICDQSCSLLTWFRPRQRQKNCCLKDRLSPSKIDLMHRERIAYRGGQVWEQKAWLLHLASSRIVEDL